MLLDKKELSVCQLMGIIVASQPLISRNLSLLNKGGFLGERKDGKLRFYSINKNLSRQVGAVLDVLRTGLKSDPLYKEDSETLKECTAFQREMGKCDMKTLKEFMNRKDRRSQPHAPKGK